MSERHQWGKFLVKRFGAPIGRAGQKTITVAYYAWTLDTALNAARSLRGHPSYPGSAFWIEARGQLAAIPRPRPPRVDHGDRRGRKWAPHRQPPRG